ncbi:MAG: hypothetical protein WD061_00175 [Candidatus Saccharimonadales bacterium]
MFTLVTILTIRVNFTKEHFSLSTNTAVISGSNNLGITEQCLKTEEIKGGKMLLLKQQRVAKTISRLEISAIINSEENGDQSKSLSSSSEQKCSQAAAKSERLNL